MTKMMMTIDTYRNHILNISLYAAIATPTLQSSLPANSIWDGLKVAMFGFVPLVCMFYEFKYMYMRRNMPPGDSGMPFFGHLVTFLKQGPQEFKVQRFRKYGTIFTHNLLMSPKVVVYTEEDARYLLTEERKGNLTPRILPHIKALLGDEAIMFQEAKSHRRLRKLFEPTFSIGAIQGYSQIIDDTTQHVLETWSSRNGFCSSQDWAILAMRLFFVCAFQTIDESLLETLHQLFDTWLKGFASAIPIVVPGSRLYKAHQARQELHDILLTTINNFKTENPPESDVAKTTMMGRLCYGVDDEGKTMTDTQLVTNTHFILFAGHDTTKGSFSAFVYYLTQYPKIRELLRQEVQTFAEPLDPNELKAAPILNAFMAETWRMVPPVDSHNMGTNKDFLLKGYKIPKGTGVSIDIQAFNVMQDGLYKNPTEFRIDRWLPKDHPFHNPEYFQDGVDYNVMSTKFRAFAFGCHMCLGAHFAKLEARIVLTRLLQKYDIEIQNNKMTKFPLMQYNNEFKLTRR